MLASFLDNRVIVKVGDITKEEGDAIVNAANSSLMGGGGVDGAIHAAAGPSLLEACIKVRQPKYPEGLPTGEAVLTSSGELFVTNVIHTVGPIYGAHAGKEAELLAKCYENSLALTAEHLLRTISFPAISTGVYRYPRGEAAKVSSAAIKQFLDRDKTIDEVRLVFFHNRDAAIFLENHVF
ncbi:MAG: O-acetyl-ADP-ribose deacetylase [Acidobacteria bacterium]|nr:O-acetyl-ADP-ribose deacetylase [Acidobacteriota bacterium]